MSADQVQETGDERLSRLMRENPPTLEQMQAALHSFCDGTFSLRTVRSRVWLDVPVEHTDPDMVLSSAITELVAARSELARLTSLLEEARELATGSMWDPDGEMGHDHWSDLYTRLTERA